MKKLLLFFKVNLNLSISYDFIFKLTIFLRKIITSLNKLVVQLRLLNNKNQFWVYEFLIQKKMRLKA